jgi:adenylate kinase
MLILAGVAGAGKSMQGKMLDESGFYWLSTGELFRQSVTGKRKEEMLAGKLLSDDEVIELVDAYLDKVPEGRELVLDGFPRTVHQADWLLLRANGDDLKLRGVFNFSISKDVVKGRLMNRGRQDDSSEVIEKRFADYVKTTLPILDYLKQKGVQVVDIDADQDPKKVFSDLKSHIDKLPSK